MELYLVKIVLCLVSLLCLQSNGLNVTNESIKQFKSSPWRDGIPKDWQDKLEQGNLLFSSQKPALPLMATVGNGYVATVVTSDTVYVAGVYNGNGTGAVDPSHRARIPATTDIDITGISQQNDDLQVSVIGYALDIESGIFYRRLEANNSNVVISIEQRWYAHRANRYLLIHELEITSISQSTSIGLVTVTLTNNSQTIPPSNDITFYEIPTDPDILVYNGSQNAPEEVGSQLVVVSYMTPVVPETIQIQPNSTSTFYFITAYRTSLDSENPYKECVATYYDAIEKPEELLPSHVAAWKDLWNSRIEIAGDLNLAQSVNSSLYYILSSVRSDWYWSPSPGGLASNGYNGHIFWDSETWMYPTIALLYPEIANSFLMYRYYRMQGALLKAESYDAGYEGTMYPWESAFTGEEVCPTSAPTGQLEQHISGDIAFAIHTYWKLSQNQTWLEEYGSPMLNGIAVFWASRVGMNGSQYVIDGVIPPDEYAVNVNNSVYTNYVASLSLQYAVSSCQLISGCVPDDSWSAIANNLKIDFDQAMQYHPEYDGYDGQIIKQADVVLLGYPLMFNMTPQVRYNDLVYYSARTDPNGPAMTWGMYAVAWLELGYNDNHTIEVFNQSYANIQPPFDVWTGSELIESSHCAETPTGGTTNFITGAGGFLQGLWAGWGGLRIKDSLTWNPQLPNEIESIRMVNISYVGNKFDVYFDLTHVILTWESAVEESQLLVVTENSSNISYKLSQLNSVVEFATGPFTISPQTSNSQRKSTGL